MSAFTLDSLLDSLSDSTAETPIEKVASTETSVADKLKETLTKEASASPLLGETNMSVQTGNAIADSILAMLEGGIHKEAAEDTTAGNNVKVELDEMEAQHAARILPTPREGKTITEVAKALAARTPGGEDTVLETEEGNAGSVVDAKSSDIDKMASVNELIAEGYSFEDSVELVKQASESLEAESSELEKAAAVSALVAEGINFEEACNFVKQASEAEEEYTDMDKSAAVSQLISEDKISFKEACDLVKKASALGK